MFRRARGITSTPGKAVSVDGNEDGAVGGSESLGLLQPRTSVAGVGAERLVAELTKDGPALPLSQRTTVRQLSRDRAVLVLGAFGRVQDSECQGSLCSGLVFGSRPIVK